METQVLFFTYVTVALTVIVSLMAFNNVELFESFLFSTRSIKQDGEYHRFLTATLIHADFSHLLFNMISLYSFATYMEYNIGWVKMLFIYLSAGLGGDILAYALHKNSYDYRAVGASGAVMGVIFASIFILPGGGVYIFFIPIAIPDWIYAILFILISLYGIAGARGLIGHEAHLGGALAGMVCAAVFYPQRVLDNLPLFIGILILIAAFLYIIRQKPHLLGRFTR